MVYVKSFPKNSATPTEWVKIKLSEKDEKEIEKSVRVKNALLFDECLNDATGILRAGALKEYQTNIVNIARALFEKRASHLVYQKEAYCREKFEQMKK